MKPQTTRKLRRRALDSIETFLGLYAGRPSEQLIAPGHELCGVRACEVCSAWKQMVRASRALTRRRHERRRGWRDGAGLP